MISELSSPMNDGSPFCHAVFHLATVAKKICILIHNSKKDDNLFP